MLKRLRYKCRDSYVEGGFMFGLVAYLVGSTMWGVVTYLWLVLR